MSFQDILNRPVTEIEPPKPLPVGSYVATVKELPKFDKVGQNETDVADFNLVINAPLEDVSQDDIKEWAGKSGKSIVGANTPRARFFLTEDAVHRLKAFVEACGIDVNDKKKTLAQLINDTVGQQVVVSIKHRTYTPQGGEAQIVADIAGYAKA